MNVAYLEVETPQGVKRLNLTDRPFTIGRHPDNALVIKDERASRFHCVVERVNGGGFQLRDLQSRNGTKLNEQRVDSSSLRSGDVFSIGRTFFRFVDPNAIDDPVEMAPERHEPAAMRRAPEFSRGGGNANKRRRSRPAGPPGAPLVVDDEDHRGRGGGGGAAGEMDEVDYNSLLSELTPDSGGESGDYEAQLLEMARAAGAARSEHFDWTDVALVNTRGSVIHVAEEKGKRRTEGREAVDLLRLLLYVCIQTRSTDMHLEPKSDDFTVRLRVDGSLVDAVRLDKSLAARIVGVVKVLADIDIAQRLVIQEGHFAARAGNRRIDYRVSFTPSMHGQKLVLRVLDLHNAPRYLHELNLPGWMFETIRRTSRQDAGMLLCCGPTGSGKTTTLYSVLRDIDSKQRNVITIEDPVEYELDGVTQIPIDEHQGNTFSSLLRSVLRQDPDVILLGEIRDKETAAIAMQAAMTGHLVLSTVHAKDTIGSVFRLLDLGVEPYLVASSLNLVLAQRLVRQLCPHCKIDKKPTPNQTMRMGKSVEGAPLIYYPVGCPRCLNTGYFGRRALSELLVVTDDLRDVILKEPTIQAMREVIKMNMFTSLQQNGFQLVAEGVTSFDEVERVTGTE